MKENRKVQNLIRSSMLLALAIVLQVVGKNVPAISQFFVGPAVNAILILTTYLCGTLWGASVGALTPLLAWLTAQLPSPMGPFVPFIMAGNIIFVVSFGLLKQSKIGRYVGVAIGAVLKYGFLSLAASKLAPALKLGIPQKVMDKLVVMMGVPQLITALAGGVAAVLLIAMLQRRNAV